MADQRPKILIVDHDEHVLIALERVLESEGYCTVTAWSGREALQVLGKADFDLLLVDEQLPTWTYAIYSGICSGNYLRRTACFCATNPSEQNIRSCQKYMKRSASGNTARLRQRYGATCCMGLAS